MTNPKNLTQVPHRVDQGNRQMRYGHSGAVVWLTGLSGSGKSTLAMLLEARLTEFGYACYSLDGDNIRNGLNANLGFAPEDRSENIRRVGEVAALFADAGLICITAFISPYYADRLRARESARNTAFYEVHIAADLAACEARDPKGLYRKARDGKLADFTGIDAPYEAPVNADLVLQTGREGVIESLMQLVNFLLERHARAPRLGDEHCFRHD
jgi:adenylyl-sulfate kinase